MPRNSSGTYSLYTPGNPVVTSTVISSTWANNTLADLASAITDSLSRTGDGGMQAPLELTNGAIGAPSLTWASETTSGWYRNGASDFRFSVAATDRLAVSATGLSVTGSIITSTATGGSQGAGTINATAVYDDGVQILARSPADPSASVGLSAVNGNAATYMRSDGAPALSQSIIPTWTGKHTFSNSGTAIQITGAAATANNTLIIGGTTTAFNYAKITNTSASLWWGIEGSVGGNLFVGTAAYTAVLGTDVAQALSLGTSGTARFTIASGGDITTTGAMAVGSGLTFVQSGTTYNAGYRQIPRSTTATTFAIGDVGKCVAVSAAINIPASTFAAGDAISVYNDSGSSINITISAGTLRLAGTTTTGTRALVARGVATLWFNVGGATPEVIASGSGLS